MMSHAQTTSEWGKVMDRGIFGIQMNQKQLSPMFKFISTKDIKKRIFSRTRSVLMMY